MHVFNLLILHIGVSGLIFLKVESGGWERGREPDLNFNLFLKSLQKDNVVCIMHH